MKNKKALSKKSRVSWKKYFCDHTTDIDGLFRELDRLPPEKIDRILSSMKKNEDTGPKIIPEQYRIERDAYTVIVKFYGRASLQDIMDDWFPGEAMGSVTIKLMTPNGKKLKFKAGNRFTPVSLVLKSPSNHGCLDILKEAMEKKCHQPIKRYLLADLLEEALKPYRETGKRPNLRPRPHPPQGGTGEVCINLQEAVKAFQNSNHKAGSDE